MTTDASPINSAITDKFQAVCEVFGDFSQNLGQMHGTMPVHNDASRVVFSSLSRITAYADQVQLILTLMREDIRVIDELVSDPVTAALTGQLEHCSYDWLKSSRATATNVH